jgi:hypothetical protein
MDFGDVHSTTRLCEFDNSSTLEVRGFGFLTIGPVSGDGSKTERVIANRQSKNRSRLDAPLQRYSANAVLGVKMSRYATLSIDFNVKRVKPT